jgi:hypothetical protein
LPFPELRRIAYLNDVANTVPENGFGDHIRREPGRRRHERFLGLDKYPIRRRSYSGRTLPYTPENFERYLSRHGRD